MSKLARKVKLEEEVHKIVHSIMSLYFVSNDVSIMKLQEKNQQELQNQKELLELEKQEVALKEHFLVQSISKELTSAKLVSDRLFPSHIAIDFAIHCRLLNQKEMRMIH